MRSRNACRALAPLLTSLVASCGPEPSFEVSPEPLHLLRAPVRMDDATEGAVLAKAREPGGPTALMVVDTSAVVSSFRSRPCAGDGGWLEVIELVDHQLSIRYEGACGSCPSSLTGTLMAIENMIREEIDPDLTVIAE